MDDPYFDKGTRGPLISTTAVVCICLTVAFCTFLGFTAVSPRVARDVGVGTAFAVVTLTVLYGFYDLILDDRQKGAHRR